MPGHNRSPLLSVILRRTALLSVILPRTVLPRVSAGAYQSLRRRPRGTAGALAVLALAVAVTACASGRGGSSPATPAFRPVQFTVSTDGGISVSLNPSMVSWAGRFSRGARPVEEPTLDKTLLIIEHPADGQVVEDRYRLGARGGIGACLDGSFQASFSSGVIRIPVSDSVSEIQVFDAHNGRKCPGPASVEYSQDLTSKQTPEKKPTSLTSEPVSASRTPRSSETRDENGFTRAEYRLLDRLSNNVVDLNTCRPNAAAEDAEVPAALNCATRIEGPRRLPLIMEFETGTGYGSYVRKRRAEVLETGSCGSLGSHNSSWSHRGNSMGALVCSPSGSYYRIFWTYDSARIVVFASSVDTSNGRRLLFDWWQKSVPILK